MATLRHASAAPYYRKAWRSVWRQVDGQKTLHRLPLLSKQTAAQVQEDLRVPGVPPTPAWLSAGVVSSATTRTGRPLRILHSPAEDPEGPTPPASQRTVRPRTLVLFSPRHGMRRSEGPDRVMLPVTPHVNTVDVLLDLLAGSGRGRIHAMVTPLSALKWITVALQERSVSPASLGVQDIGTTGYTLTWHARRWLARAWNARLWDNYSLSEVGGYAWECEACEHLHWEGPPVIFERVDPLTGGPVTGNLGELVLTTLVPHVQLMPLVRYATGDLVRVGPRCAATGSRGVQFLGRVQHSLVRKVRGQTRYAVLARDLLEWAEATPDVMQHPHPMEQLGQVPPSDLGVPKAVVDAGTHTVNVELRFDPARYPERAASVSAALARQVFRNGAPRPAIALHRPGSMDVAAWARKL